MWFVHTMLTLHFVLHPAGGTQNAAPWRPLQCAVIVPEKLDLWAFGTTPMYTACAHRACACLDDLPWVDHYAPLTEHKLVTSNLRM